MNVFKNQIVEASLLAELEQLNLGFTQGEIFVLSQIRMCIYSLWRYTQQPSAPNPLLHRKISECIDYPWILNAGGSQVSKVSHQYLATVFQFPHDGYEVIAEEHSALHNFITIIDETLFLVETIWYPKGPGALARNFSYNSAFLIL